MWSEPGIDSLIWAATTTLRASRCCSTIMKSLAGWDADIDRLLAEAVESRSTRPARRAARTAVDDRVAAAECRPGRRSPRTWRGRCHDQPSRSARFGTRFHHWVERYFGARLTELVGWASNSCSIPTTCPTGRTPVPTDEQELRELCEAFAAGRFGGTVPYAIEAPFSIWLPAGWSGVGSMRSTCSPQLSNREATGFQVVDWKTGRADAADPLQLAIYRLAWAEAYGLPWSRSTRSSTTYAPTRSSGRRLCRTAVSSNRSCSGPG